MSDLMGIYTIVVDEAISKDSMDYAAKWLKVEGIYLNLNKIGHKQPNSDIGVVKSALEIMVQTYAAVHKKIGDSFSNLSDGSKSEIFNYYAMSIATNEALEILPDTGYVGLQKQKMKETFESIKISAYDSQRDIVTQRLLGYYTKIVLTNPDSLKDFTAKFVSSYREFTKNILEDSFSGNPIYKALTNTDLKIGNSEYIGLEPCSPKGMQKISSDIPTISLDSIAGYKDIKDRLDAILQGYKDPSIYKRKGCEPQANILLFGPPGTGKTTIAKAIANYLSLPMIEINFSDIGSKWHGESETNLRKIFDSALKRERAFIFLDEIEGLSRSRDSSNPASSNITGTLLQQLNKVKDYESVMVVGATNVPEIIDSAILRAGRMDEKILVPMPDFDNRKALFEHYIKRSMNIAIANGGENPFANMNNDEVQKFVESTEGFSCADIRNVINKCTRDAAYMLSKNKKNIWIGSSMINKKIQDYNKF